MEGIKRIKEMAKGQKDEVLLEIVKYLIDRTDMDMYYLNEEKNLKEMVEYIIKEILNDFCKRNNTKNPIEYAKSTVNNMKVLPINFSNEKTFELAIRYFRKSNKELGIKKKEEKKQEVKINNKKENEFGSIFENQEVNKNKKEEKEKKEIEQISFFDF